MFHNLNIQCWLYQHVFYCYNTSHSAPALVKTSRLNKFYFTGNKTKWFTARYFVRLHATYSSKFNLQLRSVSSFVLWVSEREERDMHLWSKDYGAVQERCPGFEQVCPSATAIGNNSFNVTGKVHWMNINCGIWQHYINFSTPNEWVSQQPCNYLVLCFTRQFFLQMKYQKTLNSNMHYYSSSLIIHSSRFF